MNEREIQISWVMSMIQELCENYEIGIVPYKRDDGVLMVLNEVVRNDKGMIIGCRSLSFSNKTRKLSL